MEMMGVVFVVVFIVLGLLIYLSLTSVSSDKLPAQEIRSAELYVKALQTAMLETHVPACHNTLARVIVDCIESPYLTCSSGSVCNAAYTAWEDMLVSILGDSGPGYTDVVTYSARIVRKEGQKYKVIEQDGEEFVKEPFEDCTEESLSYAAPRQPLSTDAGNVEFVIQLC
jgi:hypothetical protein